MRSLFLMLLLVSCSRLDVEHETHAVPDAIAEDVCVSCSADQICVADFAVGCGGGTPRCVPRTIEPACTPSETSCSTECQEAYCSQPYQCQYRNGCPASPRAFTCYGP